MPNLTKACPECCKTVNVKKTVCNCGHSYALKPNVSLDKTRKSKRIAMRCNRALESPSKTMTRHEQVRTYTAKKRALVLSDVSKITSWEENIGKVQAGMSYNFHNFMVREYALTKFLPMAKDGSKIEPISNTGEVKQCKDGNDKEETTLSNALIVAVLHLDSYRPCICCKARVEPLLPPLARCSKSDCTMLQRYHVCSEHISAKLLFKDNTICILCMHMVIWSRISWASPTVQLSLKTPS